MTKVWKIKGRSSKMETLDNIKFVKQNLTEIRDAKT